MRFENIFMDLSIRIRIRSSDCHNFSKLGVFGALLSLREEQDKTVNCLDAKCAEIDRIISPKEQFLYELENYQSFL